MRVRHRRAHRRIWGVLAVLLPLLFLGALMLRPGGPLEEPAQRLSAP
jgi:hypothetical protein